MSKIVRMQLLEPAGSGAEAHEMTVVTNRAGDFECFWQLTEPEIAHQFESGDVAYFEAEGEAIKIEPRDRAAGSEAIAPSLALASAFERSKIFAERGSRLGPGRISWKRRKRARIGVYKPVLLNDEPRTCRAAAV